MPLVGHFGQLSSSLSAQLLRANLSQKHDFVRKNIFANSVVKTLFMSGNFAFLPQTALWRRRHGILTGWFFLIFNAIWEKLLSSSWTDSMNNLTLITPLACRATKPWFNKNHLFFLFFFIKTFFLITITRLFFFFFFFIHDGFDRKA